MSGRVEAGATKEAAASAIDFQNGTAQPPLLAKAGLSVQAGRHVLYPSVPCWC